MTILHTIFAALLAFATMLSAQTAHAQTRTVALMPQLGGHREIPEALHEQARLAAHELLRTENLDVRGDAPADGALSEAQRTCMPATPCASELRAALGVDVLVGLVIWGTSEARDRPARVDVVLVDEATSYQGRADVTPDGLPTAVRDAMRVALRDLRRGPGPFLEITGTEGAHCELDGRAVGRVPVTVETEPGEHQLRASLDGHRSTQLTVNVTEGVRITPVTVTLERSAGARPPPTASGEDNWPSWLVAGLLWAGAVVPAGFAIETHLASGECLGPVNEPCSAWFEPTIAPGVLWATAGVLLAAGITIAILQPFNIRVSASPSSAALEIRGELP